MRIYDHTGRRYGTWTVKEMFHDEVRKLYRCVCDCGNTRVVDSGHVTRECACIKCLPMVTNNARKGERHGRLTCLGYVKTKKGRHGFLVRCDCGNEYEVQCYSQFKTSLSCKKCSKGFHPGKRVGHCTLIESIGNKFWKKQCDCGTIFTGSARKTDCGCVAKRKILSLAQRKVGLKYHFLKVHSIHSHKDGHIQLLMKCKCGNEFIRNNGHEFKSRSCGCELSVPLGEDASNASLKNCEVISMRQFYDSGLYSISQLSKMFNKPYNYITRIIKRHIWKHV